MDRFLGFLLRARWPILFLWAAAISASAFVYLARFQIDNSVGIWFLGDDPELVAYRELNRVYGESEWTFVLVETESIHAPEFLAELAAAAARVEALDDVERVVSIANVRDSTVDADGTLRYTPILGDADGQTPLEPSGTFRERLESNPIFAGNLYLPGDERHTAVLIRNANRIDELAPYRIRLVDQVRGILAEYPTIGQIALAGTTIINAELNRSAKRDMFIYYVLISLFLVIGGRLFLSHVKDIAVLLAVVVGSVLPTLGLVAALNLPFNMVTIMLPTILVSMAVSVVVHLINELHHQRRRLTVRASLERTLANLLRPSFWTTATTVIGFLSLTPSSVIPVRQIGLLAAFGVTLSWVQALVVAPVLLHLLWSGAGPQRIRPARWGRWATHGALAIAERRPSVVLGVLGLMLLGLGGLLHLQADTDYVRFFRQDSTLHSDYARIDGTGFSQYYVSLDLIYPPGRTFTDQPAFDRLQALEAAIGSLPEVRKVLSAAQLLREADRALNGQRASLAEFAGFDSARLSQLVLLAEASGNDDLTDLLAGDRARTQLLVMTDYMSTRELDGFRARLTELVRRHLPSDVRGSVAGTNVLWANMDASIVRTQILSLLIVLGSVALLMPLLQGSLLLGAAGLTVSFLPVVLVLGLMGWMGIQVNMATCLIGGIALGVAVDDTIYLLDRIRRELGNGSDMRRAVRRGVLVTGRAMITTSLLLTGGFLTMAFSDFMPSAEFGGLFAATIILALLGDLVLLPTLLMHLPERMVNKLRPGS